MAQGFYTAQEACAKLKKTEEDLRKLVRDGQLREFRDAKGVMYRTQEVDALAGPAASDAAQDSVAELTLADDAAPAKPEKPAAPAKPTLPPGGDTSVFNLDAAVEPDAGKTDVFSLEPGSEDKKSGSGSGSSISLLDDLENITIPADPMAETVVSGGTELVDGGSGGSGGGSGLLDLAHESDDTSLGAELYDESAEGAAEPAAAGGSGSGSAVAAADSSVADVAIPRAPQMEYYAAPVAAMPADPLAPAFVGMSIVGFVLLLVAGLAVAASVIGSWPSVLEILYSQLLYYMIGAVVVTGAAWGIGFAVGRRSEGKRYVASRAPAAAAELPEAEEA